MLKTNYWKHNYQSMNNYDDFYMSFIPIVFLKTYKNQPKKCILKSH